MRYQNQFTMNQTRINGILVKDAEVVKPCSCKECKCGKEESTSEWFSRKQREAITKSLEPTDTIESIADIDVSTKEGKYLLMALSKITTESQRNRTPAEVLDQLTELKNLIL